MANPRQRRKARSSSHSGASARSKKAAQKRLHRTPDIKGPSAIREKWDPKLTVRQNYRRLGLVGDLSMRDSGGAESQEARAVLKERARPPKGVMATVERDEQGRIVSVHESQPRRPQTAWGQALNSDESDDDQEQGPSASQGLDAHASKEMWTSLEDDAKKAQPVDRFTSTSERTWLQTLVQKHDHDVDAMAQDRTENVWQRTAGQIKRAIQKAGGFGAFA